MLLVLSGGLVQCGRATHPDNPAKVATEGSRAGAHVRSPRTQTTVSPAPSVSLEASLEAIKHMTDILFATTTSVATVPPPSTNVRVPPAVQQGPTPVGTGRCVGAIESEIVRVFGSAAPWASSVAWRESNCIPTARNGASGSAGLFQLFRHDDLLAAVCPGVSPSVSWSNPDCNIRAAYALYQGSGTQPWN